MNFDPNEILFLQPHHWENIPSHLGFNQKKGLAIDAAIKEIFGNAGSRFAPYDLDLKIDDIGFHDVKSSSTMNSVTISYIEHLNALNEWEDNGLDTLYWIFEQMAHADAYRFVGMVRYSDLAQAGLLRPSQFGDGYFFSPSAARPYFLT